MFTIVRSHKGNGAESLILHAAFASHDGDREANVAGVAMAAVAARHFSGWHCHGVTTDGCASYSYLAALPFWHKDVVVVVTSSEAGTRGFMELLTSTDLYRSTQASTSDPPDAHGGAADVHVQSNVYTFGAPQAALSIKAPTTNFTHLALELRALIVWWSCS